MIILDADPRKLQEHLILVELEIRMTKEVLNNVVEMYYRSENHEIRGLLMNTQREVQNLLDGMERVRKTIQKLVEDLIVQRKDALQQIYEAEQEASSIGRR